MSSFFVVHSAEGFGKHPEYVGFWMTAFMAVPLSRIELWRALSSVKSLERREREGLWNGKE